uniref:Cadherin domain-containing protein n=1 Tax=Macrostomum lignano TaxID=282301 RepID=A0A1I8FAK4_9PLAT
GETNASSQAASNRIGNGWHHSNNSHCQCLTVSVLDDNEFAPAFTQSVYSATIDENMPAGAFVAAVFATDMDSGPNAMRLSNATNRRLSSTCLLTVSVQDVNDHSPRLLPLYNASLREDALTGAVTDQLFILSLTAADADAGAKSETSPTAHHIRPISGNLSLVAGYGPLDYETYPRLDYCDGLQWQPLNGRQPASGSQHQLKSSSPWREKFLLVEAVDPDSGLNGLVSYRTDAQWQLRGTVEFPFNISKDAWLSATFPLDREQ